MKDLLKILAWFAGVVAFLIGFALALAYHALLLVHISQLGGVSTSGSRSYNFWSGIGGRSVGLATVAAFGAAWWHRHNCHVQGCRRLGKFNWDGHVVCGRHHPSMPDNGIAPPK